MIDVQATLAELRRALGVDEVALWCWSSAKLENAWVTSAERGLRVSDRGETYVTFAHDDYFPEPDAATVASICARFGVTLAPREEEGFELERHVDAGADVREAVRAVLAAQDAVFAAVDASREAGRRWDADVLRAGRERELPFDDE